MTSHNPRLRRKRFDRFDYERIITSVDAGENRIEIVECFGGIAGSAEWTALNRCRAGGILEHCEIVGRKLISRARLGESKVRFGPVDFELGGQALEGAVVEGDTVRTKWAGVAEAGMGAAVSLAQAPGVISAVCPAEKDPEVGGCRTNRAEIVTPKYEKISFGMDYTDDPRSGATFMLALSAQREACRLDGVEPLTLRSVRLHPCDTRHCAMALSFAAKPTMKETLVGKLLEVIKSETRSGNTGLAVFQGIGIPADLKKFGREAKTRCISLEETVVFESRDNIGLFDIGEGKARIGALAALGLSEERASIVGDRMPEVFV